MQATDKYIVKQQMLIRTVNLMNGILLQFDLLATSECWSILGLRDKWLEPSAVEGVEWGGGVGGEVAINCNRVWNIIQHHLLNVSASV
jgi:hypothetical protein